MKKAFLVGCNYPGSDAALNGCVNDVFGMKSLLEDYYGFNTQAIEVQVDTDNRYTRPTGGNVKAGLRRLVQGASPGDVLFFHFSGHGTQVPTNDPSEEDGKDEAICPTDLNVIIDDDLKAIITDVPQGVNFTMVADCCHSGGMLDHEAVQVSGDKMASAGTHDPSRSMSNRSLPANALMSMLGNNTGQQVNSSNLHQVLQSQFGQDSSVAASGIPFFSSFFDENTSGNAQCCFLATAALKWISGIFGGFWGDDGGNNSNSSNNNSNSNSYNNNNNNNYPSMSNLEEKPHRRPPPVRVEDDIGVLFTGCQSHETSADACPSGDTSRAYGALSNAVQTLISENPNVTNYDLVVRVRKHLGMHNFSQNPCLECSDHNAHRGFLAPLV